MRPSPLLLAVLATAAALAAAPVDDPPPEEDDEAAAEAFFREEVRPLLAEHCDRCHGPDTKKPRGALRIVGHDELLAGGESGPAVVPGDPDESLLIRAVRYDGEDLAMPPERPLSRGDVKVLERWVEEGAVWAEPLVDPDALRHFEDVVRPLLAERCGECHGEDVRPPEGGLAITSLEALLSGGERGPALVPGDPDASLLMQAVRGEDDEVAMPPDDPLDEDEVEALARWIEAGAVWLEE